MVSMSRQPVSNVLNVADLEWTFGDKLRKIRRAARASQGDFADQIGQTRETLSAWEAGRNQPRNIVSIAKRIELAYGRDNIVRVDFTRAAA